MSGHARPTRNADSNARVFLNWLKVVSLVTAIIAALAIVIGRAGLALGAGR